MKITEKTNAAGGYALIVCALLGFWLMMSPLVLSYGEFFSSGAGQSAGGAMANWDSRDLSVATMNQFFAGFAVLMLSLLRALRISQDDRLAAVAASLGAWIAMSPWALAYAGMPVATWNNVLSGVAVTGIAAWAAFAKPIAEKLPPLRPHRL